MFDEGSSNPNSSFIGDNAPLNRCSTRKVGVHVHKFPADASPGTATDMYVLGKFGEKNGESRPPSTELFSQSYRMRASRQLTIPELVAVYPLGSLPYNPICKAALVRAP